MKTMLKKHGAAIALAVVLLAAAALVITCADPYKGPFSKAYTPPDGMGYIKLNIGKTVERTILPGSPTFTSYDLQFKDSASANVGSSVNVLAASIAGYSHPLPPDTGYTVEITANTAAGAAATGTSASFSIVAGTPTPVSVTLTMLSPVTATGTGTFAYTFLFDTLLSGTGSTASMTVAATPTGGGTSLVTPIDILTNDTDDITLDAGYYYVDITMNVPSYSPVTFRQILHIYQNMTSTWAPSMFSDDIFLATTDGSAGGFTIAPPTIPAGLFDLEDSLSSPLDMGDTVNVAYNGTETITITGATMSNYEWYVNPSVSLGTSSSFTVNTAVAPFDRSGTYLLTAEGTAGGIPYSTFLVIVIGPPPSPVAPPSVAATGTPTDTITITFATAPTPDLAFADLSLSVTGWSLDGLSFTGSGTTYSVGVINDSATAPVFGTLTITHPNITVSPWTSASLAFYN